MEVYFASQGEADRVLQEFSRFIRLPVDAEEPTRRDQTGSAIGTPKESPVSTFVDD